MLMAEEQQVVSQHLPLKEEKSRGAGNTQPMNVRPQGHQLVVGNTQEHSPTDLCQTSCVHFTHSLASVTQGTARSPRAPVAAGLPSAPGNGQSLPHLTKTALITHLHSRPG